MRYRIFLLAIVFRSALADAQVITTIAGTDWAFPSQPLPALKAPLGHVVGVAVDVEGNAYITHEEGLGTVSRGPYVNPAFHYPIDTSMVMRISPDGILTVVAGNGVAGFSGEGGPATSASLSQPQGVAVDSTGDLYIADMGNCRIRKVSGGII